MTQIAQLPQVHRPSLARWTAGIYFIAVGAMHFVVPDGLPTFMSWMYDLSDELHWAAGIAEILGGLGLILPDLVGLTARLAAAAAAGLAAVMVGAMFWHLGRGEFVQIGGNSLIAVAMVYLASRVWRRTQELHPAHH